MRRKAREEQSNQKIFDILQRCQTVRIAMQETSCPYVVPVSFGFEIVNGKAVIYFHRARQGLKLERLEANPCVCVESDCLLSIEKTRAVSLRGVKTSSALEPAALYTRRPKRFMASSC